MSLRKSLPLLMLALMPAVSSVAQDAAKNAAGEPQRIVIHYHRYDGDYEKLGLWLWDREAGRQPADQLLRPAMTDDFGPVFHIDPSLFGPEDRPAAIGFIPRLRDDWNFKDGGDRFWEPNMPAELWIVGNDGTLHTTRPDISPKLRGAFLDGMRTITAQLSHAQDVSTVTAERFSVAAGAKNYPVARIEAISPQNGKATNYALHFGEDLAIDTAYTVSIEPFGSRTTLLRNALLDRSRFYTEDPLGALYTKEATTFRLFAPTANAAWVYLYDNPTGPQGRREVALERGKGGTWEATVAGDLLGKHYTVKVDAPGPAANREVVDIHSRANTGHDGRGRIVDLRALDPEGFRPRQRPANIEKPTDAIIWEVSVRDFTMDENSGVPPALRGKFRGAALRGTTTPSGLKTGIDHLVELGVTHVQILPIQDFDNREGSDEYNWGYMTSNFNSPDGWFSTDYRNGEARVREFKEMVKAFHDAGIRVIMDVVYNHTAPNATFESIVPGYYHRLREDGSYWNGSGTGNEFRSEAPMASRFIVDSCKFWIEEYGVDGFRFDLMGLVDAETMKAVTREVQAIDPTLLVYGEPWAAAASGLAQLTDKQVVAREGLAAFNDHFRNALKGEPDGPNPGFVMDGRNRDGVKSGIAASLHDWAREPWNTIQYATCHDNLALWDKILFAAPNATAEERMKMNMLTVGVLAVSQGIFFLHAGTEIGYEKQGAHNSYNAPDSVNMIRWERKKENAALFEYTKGMIALRKAHPVFRLATRGDVDRRLKFHDDLAPTGRTIVFTLDGEGVAGESWKTCVVLINGEHGAQTFRLPDGDWTVFAKGDKAGTTPMGTASGSVLVEGRTMTVLAR